MSRTRIRQDIPRVSRRGFLRTASATAAGAGVLGATVGPASAQEGGGNESEGGGWFDGVDNYDTVVDQTGQSEIEIGVGTEGNGGNYGFSPPAVRIDSGTTITWTWTGEGGGHNVVAENGAFESEIASEAGYTFEHTFETDGEFKYACLPHKSMGMRGAILVGADATLTSDSTEGDEESSPYGGWLENVENFESLVDRSDRERIEITIGAEGNGGNFAFSPPAIHIDPGTTVVWRRAADSTALIAVAEDDSFWTDFGDDDTFEWTFTGNRVVKYACPAYERLGMRGVIVVGDPDMPSVGEALSTPVGGALAGTGLLALLSPVAFGAFLFWRSNDDPPDTR